MILYHGSNIAIKEPRLIESLRGLDFGEEFWMNRKQSNV